MLFWATRKKKMRLFFCFRTLVLFFLLASSPTIQFRFANGDMVEKKGRRLGKRIGIINLLPPIPNTEPHFMITPPPPEVEEKGRRLGRTGPRPPAPATKPTKIQSFTTNSCCSSRKN